jgi:hypothetical protein
MKKIIVIAVLLLLFSNLVSAESIDGPANIRDNANGKVIYSLNDGVIIGCQGLPINNWYRIGATVFIKESSFTKDKKIKPGEILFDKQGNEIGKALAIISPFEWEDIIFDKKLNLYSCKIGGYTHVNNIKPQSLLEKVLEGSLNISSDKRITTDNFRKLLPIQNYGYDYSDIYTIYGLTKQYKDNGFSHSYIYEYSTGAYPMGVRVVFIFNKDELVALIYNKRDMNYKFIKQKVLTRGYRIGYIRTVSEDIQKNLEDEYADFVSHAD